MIKEYKLWEKDMPLYEADKPCENKLTAYLHEDDAVRPAVVVYPGGAYSCHGELEQHSIARFYYENGYQAGGEAGTVSRCRMGRGPGAGVYPGLFRRRSPH